MDNKFKTQVKLDVTLDRVGDFEIETRNMNLHWHVELEVRSYGIKSMVVTVPDQQVILDLQTWKDDEYVAETLTLDIKDVTVEMNDGRLGFIIPHTLEFFKGKWKLVFND